jgi:signal peptidase I
LNYEKGRKTELMDQETGKMDEKLQERDEPITLTRRHFQEYSEALVVALILATVIKAFFFQAFQIPSGSMEPTLLVGDHLLVNKFVYGIRLPFFHTRWPARNTPDRGDVIVFVYPVDRSKDFIKRVIALGGDTVEIINKRVFVNGEERVDPHAHFYSPDIYPPDAGPRDNMPPVKVPAGSLFVMGDNRDFSYDSRFWGFVPMQDVVGKASIIYYSGRNWSNIHWDRSFKIIR